MAAGLEIFTQHSRSWEGNRYVYPVISRRSRGLSIGVNLNPDKVCNFDCVYCCVDRTQPGAGRGCIDMVRLGEELRGMLALAGSGAIFESAPFDATLAGYRVLSDVSFSGDGEPTACTRFPEAVGVVVEEMERAGILAGVGGTAGVTGAGGVKIVVITNATLLTRPGVVGALAVLDRHGGEVWAKLDAGTEGYYGRVNRSSVPLARVLENIRLTGRVRPIVVQSLFMKLDGEAPGWAEIEAYVGRLRELREGGCLVKGVQVYTTARATAEACVTALGDSYLDLIVHHVREAGFLAEAFYGV